VRPDSPVYTPQQLARRNVCEPAPIPLAEMQRTYEWVKSWAMLETTRTPLDLANVDVQALAHAAA